MALYEHIFIARQDVSPQQVEELQAMITQIIADYGGKITKTEYWGVKSLTYRMKKNRKGHYSLLNIEASHMAIAEMERRMRLNDDIIRHLTLRVEAHDDGDSVQLRRKKRDERRTAEKEQDELALAKKMEAGEKT